MSETSRRALSPRLVSFFILLYGAVLLVRGVEPIGSFLEGLGPLGPTYPLFAVTLALAVIAVRRGGLGAIGLDFRLSWWWLPILAVIGIVARIAMSIVSGILKDASGAPAADQSRFETTSVPEVLLLIATAWIIGAMAEEVLHRGVILPWLARIFGETWIAWTGAVIVGSLFFGIGHLYQGWAGVIGAAGGAMVWSLLYLVSKRSVWPGVIGHGAVNALGLWSLMSPPV